MREEEGNTSDVGSGCGVDGGTIKDKNFVEQIMYNQISDHFKRLYEYCETFTLSRNYFRET